MCFVQNENLLKSHTISSSRREYPQNNCRYLVCNIQACRNAYNTTTSIAIYLCTSKQRCVMNCWFHQGNRMHPIEHEAKITDNLSGNNAKVINLG